ncbi:MAG: hypothetical protein Q8N23_26875 [Archangium sp.]|nr:hypothetical protein [Archangium sp.]MDP3156329.1 hypothetical protein [Archangium sp.]MDP3570373.1 hypothetical protein [Archangium sp.]
MRIRLLTFVMSLGLFACGPVIGDPCTVSSDCGPGFCLNEAFAPGGLCTITCTGLGGVCPAGSVCIPDAIDADTSGCLASCTKDSDCRSGYTCRTEYGNRVCLGPGTL